MEKWTLTSCCHISFDRRQLRLASETEKEVFLQNIVLLGEIKHLWASLGLKIQLVQPAFASLACHVRLRRLFMTYDLALRAANS